MMHEETTETTYRKSPILVGIKTALEESVSVHINGLHDFTILATRKKSEQVS